MRKKKNFNFIWIILILICIPILIVNGTLIIKSYINKDEIPDFLGYKPFIVLSGSMETSIMVGDIVIVKECDPEELQVNDVIAFKNDKVVITHRIIEKTEVDGQKVFITKGDNNNVEDRNPVGYNSIEGKYLFKISKVGDIAMFLQTTTGTIIIVAIPLVILLIYDYKNRKSRANMEKIKTRQLEEELKKLKENKK